MLDRILIGSSAEPSDPNFENVTLLLHGDGSNGAQNNTFIDSSTNNFTITRNGNTTQGSFSPYGSNWSNYFDGSGDYLTTPSSSAFNLSTGDFTIELFVYKTVDKTCTWVSGNEHDWRIEGNANGTMYYVAQNTALINPATVLALNTWHHIALVKSGATTTLYINGVSSGTTTTNPANASATVYIGINPNNSSWAFQGYLSNVRVVKGTAVYTSAFTPSTTPLTAITNTSLLTCADNRFRDGSTNNFTLTRNGDVKVTNFAPFAPSAEYSTTTNGGSAYLDGNGDYLATPTSSNLEFGTGDFTFDGWFYRITPGTTEIPISFGGAVGAFIFTFRDSSTTFGVYGSGDFVSGAVVPSGAWTHVAVTRSSGTLRLFINGDLSASASDTTNYNLGPCYIGSVGGAYYYKGFVSNFRIVKGTAVYTAAFTPPTSPVTAITNTQLLTNFTNAAIFDNSMKNDLETVGNAQISTSVKKFGTGSMYFDGSGDWLIAPSSPTTSLEGDFTVECWVYVSSVSTLRPFACVGDTISSTGVMFYVTTASRLAVFGNNGAILTGTSQTVSLNTWVHVAYVRSNGVIKVYLNGTADAATASNTTSFSGDCRVGSELYNGVLGSVMNGYIDDLRITKGVARYTSNFTAPTAPFPNK